MRRIAGARPSPSLVIAMLALFAALSGVAVALPGTNTVNSGDVINNSLKSVDLKDGKGVKSADVVDNSLTGADIKDEPGFTNATLAAGFTNLGGGYAPAGFVKDTLGFVHLRGVMSCPAGENTAFTLPPGFRPSAIEAGPLGVGGQPGGNLQVLTSGEVRPFLPSGAAPCILGGFTFKAAAGGVSSAGGPERTPQGTSING